MKILTWPSLILAACFAAVSPAHAEKPRPQPEDPPQRETRLLRENLDKMFKMVKKAKNVDIVPQYWIENDNADQQTAYCTRFLDAIKKGNTSAIHLPKPVMSSATQSEEIIRQRLEEKATACSQGAAIFQMVSPQSIFSKPAYHHFFTLYENPRYPEPYRDIVMNITYSNNTYKKAANISVRSFSKNGCPRSDDSEYGGPLAGLFEFEGLLMAYDIGKNEDGKHLHPGDFDVSKTYFLRLFPPNMSNEELFGATFTMLQKETEDPNFLDDFPFEYRHPGMLGRQEKGGYFAGINANWAYVCSINFDLNSR